MHACAFDYFVLIVYCCLYCGCDFCRRAELQVYAAAQVRRRSVLLESFQKRRPVSRCRHRTAGCQRRQYAHCWHVDATRRHRIDDCFDLESKKGSIDRQSDKKV
jgi:hypothetical protein